MIRRGQEMCCDLVFFFLNFAFIMTGQCRDDRKRRVRERERGGGGSGKGLEPRFELGCL